MAQGTTVMTLDVEGKWFREKILPLIWPGQAAGEGPLVGFTIRPSPHQPDGMRFATEARLQVTFQAPGTEQQASLVEKVRELAEKAGVIVVMGPPPAPPVVSLFGPATPGSGAGDSAAPGY